MKIKKNIPAGGLIPSFYGVAWKRWDCDEAVCFPIPLHIVASIFRSLWIFLRCGFRVVPADPRSAYYQGVMTSRKNDDKIIKIALRALDNIGSGLEGFTPAEYEKIANDARSEIKKIIAFQYN